MTEITDNMNSEYAFSESPEIGRGVILFDGACGVCRGGANRFHRILERRGFKLMPLQTPEAVALSGAPVEELMQEMHLVTATRQLLRGVDALLYIAATIAWARPLRWLTAVPGAKSLMDRLYRTVARNRYRISRTCRLDHANTLRGWDAAARWLPGIVLVAISLAAGRFATHWLWMWAIALAMFLACKWIVWWPVRRRGTLKRNLAYFLAWTGMDADSFLAGPAPLPPTKRQWLAATGKTLSGGALIWIISRLLNPHHPAAAAWAGMIGLATLLHFGIMHLIALAWRRAGVAAEPLMREPARSTSLAEFWGRRWNTGFRFLAHDLIFRRLVRPLGVAGATTIVFVVSGLIHDAVISIPARGGYGLPTLFFLLQLAGVLLERTRPMRPIMRRPLLGWAYVFVFTVLPMPLLFHAAFVGRVIVPFLHAIGGLS